MKTIVEGDQDFFCDITAPCFQLLSAEEMELIRSSKTQIVFRKGDQLAKQGAFASYVLFLIRGLAIQYIEDTGDRNYNLCLIKPGDFVGLASVFQKNIFSYTVNAITECQAYLIEKEAITSVAAANSKFAFNLIRRYCSQNELLYDNLKKVLFKQMHGRLAETIGYLNEIKNDFPELFTLLTRKDLADFAALSVESTVKLLKSFERDGLIRLKDRDIEVLNPTELAEISRRG
ncbi:MAG TPA: Crp/Fnr family transcriptional regulator [Bacteroidales bacterium]|nr:Crp/Fnr family transcriptional regulator [Bacteroidales bacterium]